MGKKLAILAPMKAWGGIERNMVVLCREFLAQKIEPEFILTRGGQIPYPDEFPAEAKVVDLRSGGKLDSIPKLMRYLRQSRPDALLTAKDHAAKVAVLARRFGQARLPLFVSINNTPSLTLRRPIKRYAARHLYPWADGLIAVSEGVRGDLIATLGVPREKTHVIYNPMVTPDVAERVRAEVDHPWLVPGELPVIIGAGRLTPQKDFITLIEAFATLRRRRPCRLLILGEGPERGAIEGRASELGVAQEVALPGFVPDPIPWMARAAVFALSSRYEGLGNVLIEAIAAGTPAVSTDCPSGPAEILEGGRYGPLVPVGDAVAMADALESVLAAPPGRETLAAAVERFRSDTIARQYLELMGLVGERP